MTHPSGQGLVTGNRMQQARERGHKDGRTVGKEKEREMIGKNKTGSQRDKNGSRSEQKASFSVKQGSWEITHYSV